MNEKELEGAKKLIENKDVKKGSYSFIGNSNITYADIKILLDYIKQLEQENQQLKEQLQQKEEEIKELCKKIKVNEKSRRKMQKSLMEKIQEIEKARKDVYDYINFLVIIDTQLAGGRFKDTIWGKEQSERGYLFGDYMSHINETVKFLNAEAEIIEEDDEIEKISYTDHVGIDLSETVCNKLNEVIDAVNKLKEDN